MLFETYVPGEEKNPAHDALCAMMDGFDVGKSYADMMRLRIAGGAAAQCSDHYYVAHEDGKAVSRLWMGWGRHADAIGNWGNFYTDPSHRGNGCGGALLQLWYGEFRAAQQLPLCFLCTTGSPAIAALYARFGWRPAMEGLTHGPLYLPVGDSPATFREFWQQYYRPSAVLFHRPARLEYRHEIDCLLKFVYFEKGLPFGIGAMESAEAALLYAPQRCGMLFTGDGHCVGWSFDGAVQVHPLYENAVILPEQA